MSDFENSRDERRRLKEQRRQDRMKWFQERWNDKDYQAQHRNNSIWTGAFILFVGVAAFLRVYMPELPRWLFSWPMLLIAVGFFLGIRHSFRGAAWFIVMLVGTIFLYDRINPDISLRPYIWPIGLIVVGLFFIFRPRRACRSWDEKKNPGIQDRSQLNEGKFSEEDFVDSTSIFGGAKKNIFSKSFKGGDIVNIFGGTDLDLTQADFTGTATIELTTIFGGTKLIVPSNWSIKSEAVILFGSVEDKRKMQTITENPDKTLLLRGTVIFGGIDIKSY